MGIVFGATIALTKLANQYIGNTGVYAIASLSGLADVDAIILSLSSLAKNGLNPSTAHYAILIAIVTNTLAKSALVLFLGKFPLFRFVLTYYFLSIGAFAISALIVLA